MDLLIQEHSKHPDKQYMFPSPVTREMYHPDSMVKLHEKILKDAGLEHIRFHDLRHPNVKPKTKNFYSLLRINGQASGHIVAYFLPASHPAKLHDRLEFVVMIVIQKEEIFFDGSALS